MVLQNPTNNGKAIIMLVGLEILLLWPSSIISTSLSSRTDLVNSPYFRHLRSGWTCIDHLPLCQSIVIFQSIFDDLLHHFQSIVIFQSTPNMLWWTLCNTSNGFISTTSSPADRGRHVWQRQCLKQNTHCYLYSQLELRDKQKHLHSYSYE